MLCLALRLESQLRTYSWYDRGLPQGDELQSFVPLYEMSLTCGGTADTIVEYHKVTSYTAFVTRYELSLRCGGLVRPRNTTR